MMASREAGLLALQAEANYRGAIRSAVRGLWSGAIDYDQFWEAMDTAINYGLAMAWYEGARECGIQPADLSPEERMELRKRQILEMNHVGGLAADVEAGSKANGGKLGPLMQRAEAWILRARDVMNQARVMACGDQKLAWRLGATKEHCFPNGTSIVLADGSTKPIEDVQVGDFVLTLEGSRRVTRTYERRYAGDLVEVVAGRQRVAATPNHEFLTLRGWVRADNLSESDQIVLSKNVSDGVKAHITFPNALNRIAAFAKIGILRTVALLLRQLPFGQGLPARVSVPVVPISLDDDVLDFGVDHELGLDEGIRFVTDSHLIEETKESQFQLSRRGLLDLNPGLEQVFPQLWFFSPEPLHSIADAPAGAGLMGRVVLNHMGTGGFNLTSPGLLFRKKISVFAENILYLRGGVVKFFGNLWSCHGLVHFSYLVDDALLCPQGARLTSSEQISAFWGACLFSVSPCVDNLGSERLATDRTGNQFQFSRLVAASGRAKLKSVLRGWIDHALEFISAVFTHEHGWFFGLGLSRIGVLRFAFETFSEAYRATILSAFAIGLKFLTALQTQVGIHRFMLLGNDTQTDRVYTRTCSLYNLEVESAQHYVANGFVVHNCSSCAKLHGKVKRASYWQQVGVQPQNPPNAMLECGGWKCACILEPTDEPLSRGPLPNLP